MKFVQMRSIKKIFIIMLVITSLFHQQARAQEDIDEAFDPFSDYNEFDQDAEEEADINFFKNGRYLTLGFLLGYRGYTEGFSQAYSPAVNYGVQFSYFFDLQIAASLGYSVSENSLQFKSYSDAALTQVSKTYSGSVNIQNLDLSLKYYLNTENVTRGLADLNPYLHGGFGMYTNTYTITNQLEITPDQVFGFKFGAGLEVPILRHRAYLGFQATYHYVTFPDENRDTIEEENPGLPSSYPPISPRLNGDIFDLTLILGMNF